MGSSRSKISSRSNTISPSDEDIVFDLDFFFDQVIAKHYQKMLPNDFFIRDVDGKYYRFEDKFFQENGRLKAIRLRNVNQISRIDTIMLVSVNYNGIKPVSVDIRKIDTS